MIELTRLNGNKFSVNCDLIKYVEAAPDTTLTLVTGEKLLVVEGRELVVELILGSRAQVLQKAWPEGLAVSGARLAFAPTGSQSELPNKGSSTSSIHP